MKLTYLGAGSAVFARQVLTDILCVDGLHEGTFALVDIDEKRLERARRLVEKLIERSGKDFSVVATTERQEVLAGSDYVVNSIEVNGPDAVAHEYEIPLKYGVDQCVGDTIGPGGVFKVLRTGPTWLDIVRDIERLAPRAIVMNYTNPMSALTLAALRTTTSNQVIGLCHSVQATSRQLAEYMDIPYDEMVWDCAGINHNSWFTRLEHRGEDLYPRLRAAADDPTIRARDAVRFDVMKHFGAFVTESSGHFSEYVPYYRKRPELIEEFAGEASLGESGWYAHNWPTWRVLHDEHVQQMLDGRVEIPDGRSHEFAATIVEAVELDRPAVVYGNVLNSGLITNLPPGCVEVATLVDGRGMRPCHFGALPEQLAALNRAHTAVHELMVTAITERRREPALHALMLDPLTAAVCSLGDIRRMFDELWEIEADNLEGYS